MAIRREGFKRDKVARMAVLLLMARFFERVITVKLSRCLTKIAKSFVFYQG